MSDEVDWPKSVLEKYEDDKVLKEQQASSEQTDATTVRRLRRSQDLFYLIIEGASNGKSKELDDSSWNIEDIQGKSINIKIKYDSPELISMSDQSIQDNLKIKLKKPLIGTNGLEMKSDGLDRDKDGGLTTTRGI